MNLYEILSNEDKIKMNNYIQLYSMTNEQSFIGLEQYLNYWAKSKKTLYHLLGDSLKITMPFNYIKDKSEICVQITNLAETHPFITAIEEIIYNDDTASYSPSFSNKSFWRMLKADFINCEDTSYKLDFITLDKEKKEKVIFLPVGMKSIRAIQKFLLKANVFSDKIDTLYPLFEQFKIAHSMILNDKNIKGNLVLSIHPFDYLTMSDNNSSWSSCMSWSNDGCYKIGSVEMMNSNNVICAYIESDTPYYFNKKIKNEENSWNNKKWRQLIYITKDIIMAGKSYPYTNDDVTKQLLSFVKELAKNNLSWNYSYGPELYLDMKHIYTYNEMQQNKDWLRLKQNTKHNIILDTNGMYNDMIRDKNYNFWCYRNKVKKMKIISVSGKAPCLNCGVCNFLELDMESIEWDGGDYNDRFEDTSKLICPDCYAKGTCYKCAKFIGSNDLVYFNGEHYCKECMLSFRKCPCCNDMLDVYNFDVWNSGVGIIRLQNIDVDNISLCALSQAYNYKLYNQGYEKDIILDEKEACSMAIPIVMCPACFKKYISELFTTERVGFCASVRVSKKIYTKDEIDKHPIFSKSLFYRLQPYIEEKIES